jgi:hypothetical protein
MNHSFFLLWTFLAINFAINSASAQSGPSELADTDSGATKAINALWVENSLAVQFWSTNRIVVASIEGPAEITMIHFAFAQAQVGKNPKPLGRDVVLRIYWDGDTNPAVECPLVDFFCAPSGTTNTIANAMIMVNRGFNAWFPMPFRKSARVEIDYEGPTPHEPKLQSMMPCYSYVCYRKLEKFPKRTGYFHASWQQETTLLGSKPYVALETAGKGRFIGWNVAVHSLYHNDYPVDENEKFYIDGETNASVEFQGLEDSFGFSWGFPAQSSLGPLTGYVPFKNGAFAYRFFLSDSIHFEKSLKIVIGFGVKEKGWMRKFSKPNTAVQISSTVYWYQTRQVPLPPLPPPDERLPIQKSVFPGEAK